MDRAEWLHGTSCLGQPSWLSEPAQQNDPASFQLTSCNSEAISAELTTDCRVGFKPCRIAYRATNEAAQLM